MFGFLKKSTDQPGATTADPSAPAKPAASWRERLKAGLARTRAQLGGKLKAIAVTTAERSSAVGLTRSRPAMSGPLPWTASKTAAVSLRLAPGATPGPPVMPARRSLTMSPYRFGRTSTS